MQDCLSHASGYKNARLLNACATGVKNCLEFSGAYRLDTQARATPQKDHICQSWHLAKFGEGQFPRKLSHQPNIHHHPRWLLRIAFGIKVLIFGIPGGVVRIARANDLRNSCNTRWLGTAVIKQHLVSHLHLIAQRVPGLIISHPIPASGLLFSFSQIINAENIGLTLHQPIPYGGSLG